MKPLYKTYTCIIGIRYNSVSCLVLTSQYHSFIITCLYTADLHALYRIIIATLSKS